MAKAFIEIDSLVKRYGPFTAVDGISLTVARGEVLGFLGPNGAGKSTTMKVITGFLRPDGGTVRICGHDLVEATIPAQASIGYLPEGAPAYGDMTPRQFLRFIADVRGLGKAGIESAIGTAVARTQLDGVLDQPIETLSKGFKRRVGLAQAILHNPPVLVLDEPTDGLDPNQKHAVRRLIADMAADKAIIISTHILEEVEAVCSRAVIIDRGRVVADGTPGDLVARSRFHNAVTLEVGSVDAGTVVAALKALEGVASVEEQRVGDTLCRLTVFPADPETRLIDAVSRAAREKAWDVKGLYAEQGRLDEVFRTITTPDAAVRTASGGAAA